MTAPVQWARIHRLGPPYRAEIVHARYVEHRFARHAHEHCVIGLVEDGVQQYTYRGARHTTPAGQVFFVNGGEPHTGEPGARDGYLYRTLCLSPDILRLLATDIVGRSYVPWLRGTVVDDRELAAALRRLHQAVETLERESALITAVRRLIEVHAESPRPRAGAIQRDSPSVRRAKEYLDAHYASDVSLSQLGALTSRSPSHLARAFTREVGLPPHAYLESIRVRQARAMLQAGVTVAATALAVGYSDQSHFTHRFRRLTGLTPGQYARAAR